MGIVIVMLVIAAGAAWIAWRRWRHGQASTAVSPQAMSPADRAHKAFVHGNSCLMEGKFDDARTAFHQAREIEPKHPHVAGRLAEVERQQAASAVAPAHETC
jgi:cytochrome c-type biogenesis protein CcmH/NrfG